MVRISKSIFFPAKNKRLAKVISIKSPTEFRRSIRTLRKGGLTLEEKKSALASELALEFVKLLPIDVRLKNSIVRFVVVCWSKVIESTKIVLFDIEEKKVVLVIVNALTDDKTNRTAKISSGSFFLILSSAH